MTTEWIPVSERLPEILTKVLVYLDNKTIAIGIVGEYSGNWFLIPSQDKREITHWMPLPEGPK